MANGKWYKEAKKRWGKKVEWIEGEGQFALLAHCRVLTVTLWSTREEANKKKTFIDETGCGGMCTKKHEIIDLSR